MKSHPLVLIFMMIISTTTSSNAVVITNIISRQSQRRQLFDASSCCLIRTNRTPTFFVNHSSRSIQLKRSSYHSSKHSSMSRPFESTSRSTSNPDEGINRNEFVTGREKRRDRLHNELVKIGIDPNELESYPEKFGTAAIRTYNSYLLPKSIGAMAVADSPTRSRVVANNISFLHREYRANQERWLINVDRNRRGGDDHHTNDDDINDKQLCNSRSDNNKHPITVILDNVRSARNVGNILRLAEAAQIESVHLCGMTPRPPHPKVLKTALGAAEYVSLGGTNEHGDDEQSIPTTTLQTVLNLKAKNYKVLGVETTENATIYWDNEIQDNEDDRPIAFVFGNELIGVDVEVLQECEGIICLPTYGIKNSLNIATCAGIVVWDRLRRLKTIGHRKEKIS